MPIPYAALKSVSDILAQLNGQTSADDLKEVVEALIPGINFAANGSETVAVASSATWYPLTEAYTSTDLSARWSESADGVIRYDSEVPRRVLIIATCVVTSASGTPLILMGISKNDAVPTGHRAADVLSATLPHTIVAAIVTDVAHLDRFTVEFNNTLGTEDIDVTSTGLIILDFPA